MMQVLTVQFLGQQKMKRNKSLFEDAGSPNGTWLSLSLGRTCSSAGELPDLFLDRAEDYCINLETPRIMCSGQGWLQLFHLPPGVSWMRQSTFWNRYGKINCCKTTWNLSGLWERLQIQASVPYSRDSSFSFTGLQQMQASVASMPEWHWRLFVALRSTPCINLPLSFWFDPCLQDSEGSFWNGLRRRGFDPTKRYFKDHALSRDKRLWRRWRLRQSLKRRRPKRCRRKSTLAGYTSFAGLLFLLGCLQLLGHFAPRRWHSGRDRAAALQASKSGTMGTRPGPKSRVHTEKSTNTFTFQFWFFVCFLMLKGTGVYGVKVEGIPTLLSGAAGAQAAAAKPGGRTAYDFSRLHCGNLAKQLVRKRSYKRALLRAQQNGVTMYRGRSMTAQQAAWYSPPKLVQVHSSFSGRRRD